MIKTMLRIKVPQAIIDETDTDTLARWSHQFNIWQRPDDVPGKPWYARNVKGIMFLAIEQIRTLD